MSGKQDNQIPQLEAAQPALRESIEATKGLAEKAECLLQQHTRALQEGDGTAPASPAPPAALRSHSGPDIG
jgi:hypothetical protein